MAGFSCAVQSAAAPPFPSDIPAPRQRCLTDPHTSLSQREPPKFIRKRHRARRSGGPLPDSWGLLPAYITAGGLGFAATGLISAGFEFGAELSWPVSEEYSSGVLNISAQALGVLFISVLQVASTTTRTSHYKSFDMGGTGYIYMGSSPPCRWAARREVIFLTPGLLLLSFDNTDEICRGF
jgi:hypothetical protein